MELSKFTKEDLASHKILDGLLSKNAVWNVSTGEAVQVYRSLVWFSQLKEKLEAHQAELGKLILPEEKKEEKKAKKKDKAE